LNSEKQIEKEIQEKNLDAPRLCPADIDRIIVGETYTTLPSGKAMICELTLKNGFSVRGESACVSKENFNEEIGRKIARENARNKIWELEGYLLQQGLMPTILNIRKVAEVCHEVNRVFCEFIGDSSQPAWKDAPAWQKESAIDGVHFHLSNPDAGPSASHDNWLADKEAAGWKYGPIKDPEKKEHPCMVPYEQLPREQQVKDSLFIAVVKTMCYGHG
jgi:hypothetical protein